MSHFDYHVRVGYADVDQMGFVHHSRYLVYLESARTELLRTTGTSYREWEARGVLLPLTGCEVQYRRAARYDDEVLVRTHLATFSRTRVSFRYEVLLRSDESLLATGRTDHFFMSPDGKPIRCPAELLALLQPFAPADPAP